MRFIPLIALACLLAAAQVAAQQIYRWVDADGVVHYSDQPPAGDGASAVDIDVPPAIENPVRDIATRRRPAARAPEPDDDAEASGGESVGSYRSGQITAPEPQQVLWNLATRLPVAMTLEPALAGSHRVQWQLDGQPIGEPVSALSTTLEPVYRGTHTLTATVVNEQGATMFRTDPIEFYVQQASVLRR